MNHQGREMKNSTDVVEEATELKWYVYTLMMANLRKDVELHLVDPILGCNKLYPDLVKYGSVQGATAALYAHYDAARRRSAGTQVPPTFWAGPHELRAIAQYLQEPIMVFDVNPAGDAHVQRYSYGKLRLKDGTDHESGCCNTATDREATEYLRTCWRLHVLPTFVVLRHHERHFYGVSHGELYLRWRVEGDSAYTGTINAEHDWKEYVNDMNEHEQAVDLNTVNQLVDSDKVNALMLKRCEMRVRMHARLGLPILDRHGIEADWDAILEEGERHIHVEYGIDGYAANSQSDAVEEPEEYTLPSRSAGVATGDVTMTSYYRILRVSAGVPMDHLDKPLADATFVRVRAR